MRPDCPNHLYQNMKRLEALYDSEINFSLSTFWDAGWYWRLGDEANGWKAEGQTQCLGDAINALHRAAVEHYPDSRYAKLMTTAQASSL